ncbi:transporter [bacterium]|nr:transporter [bacterium]
METDRPDFTEGTQPVQAGHIQFELGYTFATDDDNGEEFEEHVAPELLARIGLVEDLELRLTWAGFLATDLNGAGDDGVSDAGIGFKHRIYRQEGLVPDFSFIGELSVPVGSPAYTADAVEVGGKFLWAYGLEGYMVGGNLNVSALEGSEERYLEISNSVTVGMDLSGGVGVYLEYFGLYPADDVVETTEHYTNGGFTVALSKRWQLDLRAGFGMNGAADDLFTGAGLSFLL